MHTCISVTHEILHSHSAEWECILTAICYSRTEEAHQPLLCSWKTLIFSHQSAHTSNIGVIPGPHLAKDLNSFLIPFEEECVLLAQGVKTYDALTESSFDLHAYKLFQLGGIISIEKYLGLKGHNSVHPCRSCSIKAIRDTSLACSPYYPALAYPRKEDGSIHKRDPARLKLHGHNSWHTITEQIKFAHTEKEKDQIAKETGIRGMPAMPQVFSLNFAHSVP